MAQALLTVLTCSSDTLDKKCDLSQKKSNNNNLIEVSKPIINTSIDNSK